MAVHKPAFIHETHLDTIKDVVNELQRLDKLLADTDLHQYQLFNGAYFMITSAVQRSVTEDYFKNPKFIEKFIVTFASYYFTAINDTVSDSSELSVPWSKLNDYAKQKSAPKFVSLLLGANAHINNDLPQVLKTLMEKENTEDLLSDIVKIDKLLMESGKQIIGTFDETNKIVDLLKRHFQFMYYRPAMYTIRYWRIIAWKNYRKLKKEQTAMQKITRRSIKIANRWLVVSKALS